MIELAIMRHGEAAMLSPDSDRPLTQSGLQSVELVAPRLASIETIWVSPYVRAQQTLQCLSSLRPDLPQASVFEGLTPDASLPDLLAKLAVFQGASLLLIGHNPLFSMLAATLCGESYLSLTTAGVARLQGEMIAPGCMNLVELL